MGTQSKDISLAASQGDFGNSANQLEASTSPPQATHEYLFVIRAWGWKI